MKKDKAPKHLLPALSFEKSSKACESASYMLGVSKRLYLPVTEASQPVNPQFLVVTRVTGYLNEQPSAISTFRPFYVFPNKHHNTFVTTFA